MRPSLIILWIALFGLLELKSVSGQVAAVKFIVTIPAPDTSKNRTIFLAGSFNGWSSHDSLYIMNRESESTYSLLVPLFEGRPYTYKYTRGNWNTVETRANDSDVANRRLLSRDGMMVYDTVAKWKRPAEAKAPSPQMQRLLAMRDSAKIEMQSTLDKLLGVLKEYNENMLAPKPSDRTRKKLNKQTIDMLGQLYGTLESLVWQIGMSLSPEQKEKVLNAIKSPDASKDLLKTLGNAYGEALK